MLRSLTLDGFKSFRHASVPLGPFTLLVGTNASGKSNVRDALRFLHGCAQGYTLAEVMDEKWGPGGALLWRGVRGGAREIAWYGIDSFSVQIEAETSKGGRLLYRIQVRLAGDKKVPEVRREMLERNGQMVFDSDPPQDPVNQGFPLHLRVRFQRRGRSRSPGPTRLYLSTSPILSQVAEDEGVDKKVRELVRSLVKELQEMRFLDLSPDAMREPAAPGHRILGDRGENLSSVLFHIANDPQRKAALLAWLRALTPLDVVDLQFREDLLGRVLVYLVEGSSHQTSAASASDGTLRFLALAAALLSPESGQLYFFEEIDNGFHPTRLHLLLDVLEQASRRLGCQIVATTHNPQLLLFLQKEAARQDAVLLYRREGSDRSEAIPLLDLPDIQRILESQDLGRLFATGWLEDTVEFMADEEAPPRANVG